MTESESELESFIPSEPEEEEGKPLWDGADGQMGPPLTPPPLEKAVEMPWELLGKCCLTRGQH